MSSDLHINDRLFSDIIEGTDRLEASRSPSVGHIQHGQFSSVDQHQRAIGHDQLPRLVAEFQVNAGLIDAILELDSFLCACTNMFHKDVFEEDKKK